jgi:hypothetical protein
VVRTPPVCATCVGRVTVFVFPSFLSRRLTLCRSHLLGRPLGGAGMSSVGVLFHGTSVGMSFFLSRVCRAEDPSRTFAVCPHCQPTRTVRWTCFLTQGGGHVVFPLTCLPHRRSEPYIRCLPPLPADAHGPLDLLFDSRWWARLLISRLAASLSDLQRALARRHVCWWIRTVRWTCFLTRGGGLVYSSLAWLHRSWICSARWLTATCAGGSARSVGLAF